VKSLLKKVMYSGFGAVAIVLYLRLVYHTSRVVVVFPDGSGMDGTERPMIYANWHGNNFLFPFYIRGRAPCTALAARHGDGYTIGKAGEMLGLDLVYGSGSQGPAVAEKGGARAFLALLRRLRAGDTVFLTADIPKDARVVGEGVVLLARKSGALIAPNAMATSRRKVLNNWDRAQIFLPFSRLVFVIGTPIHVPDDGSDLTLHRDRLKAAIDAAQDLAFRLADGEA
jgi:lysophospholipid acyltransferase (LPLAT)-like uncharacterized protein